MSFALILLSRGSVSIRMKKMYHLRAQAPGRVLPPDVPRTRRNEARSRCIKKALWRVKDQESL